MISKMNSSTKKVLTLNTLRVGIAALTILTLAIGAKPSKASGSWPPSPTNAGDTPFTTGIFKSNGVTYTITFVDVSNTANDPATNPPGISQAVVTWSSTGPPARGATNITTYTASNTTMGSASSLWRIGSVAGGVGIYGSGPGGSAKVDGTGSPFFRYKITCSKPPSKSFSVSIRIANGVSSLSESADAGSVSILYPNSAVAQGSYPSNLLEADDPGNLTASVTNYRDVDAFQSALIVNGVGWFAWHTPVHIHGTITVGGSGASLARVDVVGSWEFVPIQVLGP